VGEDGEFPDEEDEALLAERDRISTAPAAEDPAGPGLSRFRVEVEGAVEAYAARLRAVVGAALDHAVAEAGLDAGAEPREVPGWFAAVCAGGPGEGGGQDAPDFARRGGERYAAAGHGGPWDLPGWLERFDPDSAFRTWSWWDLTRAGDRQASLWVDAAGEDFFSCDELRWAAYTAGAVSVTGPEFVRKDVWPGRKGLADGTGRRDGDHSAGARIHP
jgi:hypothetical protein